MTNTEKVAPSAIVDIIPLTTTTVPPYTSTNTVIYGNKSFLVIDPGTSDKDQQEILRRQITQRIDEGRKFLGVGLTHHHGDHVKSAVFLKSHFDIKIMAHPNAAQRLKFPVDHLISDGEIVLQENDLALTALYTPGHADDHVVFFDDKTGILIAGDMITDRGTVLIPPPTGSLKSYLESLDKLTRLSTLKMIIPAHGNAIRENPRPFLINAVKHRYQRILSVLDMLIKNNQLSLDATDITLATYGHLTSKDLLTFAQLSVESSLHWLHEMNFIKNVNFKWQVVSHDLEKTRKKFLLLPLKEIDERLRNS